MTSADSGELPAPLPVSQPPDPTVRLVRLRAEFAVLYPGLDPGPWYPAASVVAYFRTWLARHPGPPRASGPLRGLYTTHFDFRGGVPRDAPWLAGESPDEREFLGGG